MRDTIFALATAPARAAVAVVRISGPEARSALGALVGRVPRDRTAGLRRLNHPDTGELIDEPLVLWLPGPGSYTGEDCAELQLHGGPAVIEATLEALAWLGLRLAEPGEFTRRAFESGRLSLSEAEAVADLVEAETAAQRKQALAQLSGALRDRYDRWRVGLLEALSWLEAEIDFPDEDLPEALAERAGAPLRALAADLERAQRDFRGERVREGVRVALIGAPNAGKSSLINLLAEREAAIVTAIPGTTRDVIEAALTLSGYRVLLADMAGVRETADLIEQEGVRRARAWAEGADLRLWLVDQSGAGAWAEAAGLTRTGDILVLSKSDLPKGPDAASAQARATELGLLSVELTLERPDGADDLRAALAARVETLAGGRDFPAATRLRHRDVLKAAAESLGRAIDGLDKRRPAELVAEDVRLAARALERLSGRVDAEAVLDRVFASFCIGK